MSLRGTALAKAILRKRGACPIGLSNLKVLQLLIFHSVPFAMTNKQLILPRYLVFFYQKSGVTQLLQYPAGI